MSDEIALGIIGGSGLYSMKGFAIERELESDTPFGKPSAPIVIGLLENKKVAFLARHGLGHHISPTEVNYRANIYALKQIGVQRIVSISACGSLREDYAPGDIVIPDQVYDNTRDRERTFFSDGLVAHIGVADPFCEDLSAQVRQAARSTGATVHSGGTYITVEGPRFSTRAESNVYRSWGMSIIGMTTSPEVYLAREAEICYSVLAHVTDYDVWHISEAPVTAQMVFKTLLKNTEIALDSIYHLLRSLVVERKCECEHALESALATQPDAINSEARQKLDLLVRKYLK